MSLGDEPAFPKVIPNQDQWSALDNGMNLREYFAGQALPAVVAQAYGKEVTDADVIARDTLRIADALLAALEPAK